MTDSSQSLTDCQFLLGIKFFLKINLFIYFIFGCVGSSLLGTGFL